MTIEPTVSPVDAELFYGLWMPLLEFANHKHHIVNDGTHFSRQESVDPAKAQKIAQYIWENTSCIDEYLKQAKIPEKHAEIIHSWKHCVSGVFIIERHLKKGSVFISDKGDVFIVKGLNSTFEELLPWVPVAVKATLLPFEDTIISDGLFSVYPVHFGKGMADEAKKTYLDAKRDGTIRTSL